MRLNCQTGEFNLFFMPFILKHENYFNFLLTSDVHNRIFDLSIKTFPVCSQNRGIKMKTPIELMQLFTAARVPNYTYSPFEVKCGCADYIISARQQDWLFDTMRASIDWSKAPKGVQPRFDIVSYTANGKTYSIVTTFRKVCIRVFDPSVTMKRA